MLFEEVTMLAKEVMQILGISRPSLCKYVKQGLIKVDSAIKSILGDY